MSAIPMSEIRESLAEFVNRVAYSGERVVINRSGKQVAALISMSDLALLEKLENMADIRDARKALAEAKVTGTLSWKKVKAEAAR